MSTAESLEPFVCPVAHQTLEHISSHDRGCLDRGGVGQRRATRRGGKRDHGFVRSLVGLAGMTFNASAHPGLLAPLVRVSATNSYSNDQESNVDGLDTICFNQRGVGVTSGVRAFKRLITANAPGASVGSSGPAAYAGQILDSDTLFRPDGQVTFAPPAALATAQGQGAYDLETFLAHELGHWFGLDHPAVWRALMFPYTPPPGQFLGDRPTSQKPDGILADDDRTGIRALYPDPNDAVNLGAIRGRILPANPFVLATLPAPYPGENVTGVFGAHVVAIDADTGAVVAGTLGGWSCRLSNPTAQFDGSFDIERLPIGHNYIIYAEPLDGLIAPSDLNQALNDLCSPHGSPACTPPTVNANFNPRTRPANP